MDENEQQEAKQAATIVISNKSGKGYIVETASGLRGRTYHTDELVNGKMCVYLENSKQMLCTPTKLKLIGFID